MRHHATQHAPDIERLEARISTGKKTLLKSAASISGRSLTDFVVDSAYEEAVRIIQEYQQLHLSVKDSHTFVQVLLNPPQPSQRLLKAAKTYKNKVISD